MTDVSRSIGNRFERYFQTYFPWFESHVNDGHNVPDFYNPTGKFWVEAKVGNRRWGPDLKHYQRDNFKRINEPIIYCFGLHNFDDARTRLDGKSNIEMRHILRHQMRIEEVYFITKDIVEAVIDAETRVSKDGRAYCTMKRPILKSLFSGKPFKRFGKPVKSAEEYYGYENSNLDIYQEQNLVDHTSIPLKGIMLSKETDKSILDYLRLQNMIK